MIARRARCGSEAPFRMAAGYGTPPPKSPRISGETGSLAGRKSPEIAQGAFPPDSSAMRRNGTFGLSRAIHDPDGRQQGGTTVATSSGPTPTIGRGSGAPPPLFPLCTPPLRAGSTVYAATMCTSGYSMTMM
jgi:hypothetical protein